MASSSTWFEQLDFKENPLDARPNSKLIGLKEEEDQLKNHVLKEEVCFLNGFTGAGKTSLLRKIQESMDSHSFIYLDADALPGDFKLVDALKKKRSFLDKIRLKDFPSKKPVLIIDEFQATDQRLTLEARSNWENPNERRIKSIIIAQISTKLKNITGSFKDRLGNRIITLKPLDDDDMKRVLRLRLENEKNGENYFERLSPDAVELIVKAADGNARRLLEYADMIFDFHFRRFKDINPIAKKEDYVVTYHGVKEILTVNNISTDIYEESDQRKREAVPYEQMFSLSERNALQCFSESDELNMQELRSRLHLSTAKVRKILASLEEKDAVVQRGNKDNKKLWQITQFAKRVMVKK
jgi:hypothetical protein